MSSSDVPSVAQVSALKQQQVGAQVAMAVAKKSLDAARAQGDAAISLLQAAVDMQQKTLPPAPGKGRHFDTRA